MISYFGFYDAIEANQHLTDFISEINDLACTNIVHIIDYPDTPDTTTTCLQNARDVGLKVVVDIDRILFSDVTVKPWVFAVDWQARWAARWALYQSFQHPTSLPWRKTAWERPGRQPMASASDITNSPSPLH